MAGKTPIEALKSFRPLTHEAIGAMPVVVLDQFNMHIDDLFDLKEIPWDNSPRNIKKLNETMAHYLNCSPATAMIYYSNQHQKCP